MTTQTQQIYRRTNGTIDIDHYRNRALTERRAAMTSTGRRLDVSFLKLAAVAAVIAALIELPMPKPKATAAKVVTAANTVTLESR